MILGRLKMIKNKCKRFSNQKHCQEIKNNWQSKIFIFKIERKISNLHAQ